MCQKRTLLTKCYVYLKKYFVNFINVIAVGPIEDLKGALFTFRCRYIPEI